jgi:hypothetical protein
MPAAEVTRMTTPLTGPLSFSSTKNLSAASVFVGTIFEAFAGAPFGSFESWNTRSWASGPASAMTATAIATT